MSSPDWKRFRESFENFIVQDLKKALKSDLEVSVIVLTAIGIECLSGYFVGKKSDAVTFKRFIDEFMPAYSRHSTTLYKCVRSGLAHDYIIKDWEGKSFLFTRNRGEKHLVPVKNKEGWYYLNREQFALDFLEAQEDFFTKVEHDSLLFRKAMIRLNSKGFLDVFSYRATTIFVDAEDSTDKYDGATGTSTKKF